MSIRKEDVYKLIDEMDKEETELAHKVLKNIMKKKSKNIMEIEADNSPLDEEERAALGELIKEDTVDWEDVKRELEL